ncbi:hypothetical protein JSY14_05445 [Brachybacterium sp. EF45031]|uniref:hypothetical protein n=1 Tax=Brachybacterium sillae TaxID=2810536 RepID=UPI00217CF3CD|nr:hypothetical protein [Brachybacterium sillae]MCS6711496.1 hypothetical protein [Brachybacterium sillae]
MTTPAGRTGPSAAHPPGLPPVVLPHEYLLDSRREILTRLGRRSLGPAVLVAGVWATLWLLFVLGSGPSMWVLSLLVTATGENTLGMTARSAGVPLRSVGLGTVLVPLLGVLVSFALLPWAARSLAALEPPAHPTEAGFREVATRRAAAPWLLPPVAALGVLLLLVATQVRLPWRDLSYGALHALGLMILVLAVAWAWLRQMLRADTLLSLPPPGRTSPDQHQDTSAQRDRALAAVAMPDTREVTAIGAPRQVARRALTATVGQALPRVGLTAAVLMWLVLGVADMVIVIIRLGDLPLTRTVSTGMPWFTWAGLGLLLAATLTAWAVAPLLARRMVAPDSPEHLQRFALLVSLICGGVPAVGTILLVLAHLPAGRVGVVGAITAALTVLVLSPLAGESGRSTVRHDPRPVLQGPVTTLIPRPVPWRRIAPEHGTRRDVARDPSVRAEAHRRLLTGDPDPYLAALVGEQQGPWSSSPFEAGASTAPGSAGTLPGPASVSAHDPGTLPDLGVRAESPRRRRRGTSAGSRAVPDSLAQSREWSLSDRDR